MKFSRNIKRALGLLYVLGLSFCAIGANVVNKAVQSKAVDEYDTEIPFQGLWSFETNMGTQQSDLCYTGSEGLYEGTQYFFNVKVGTYYSLCETADIECSMYYYDTGNNNEATDLQDVTAIIHLDNVTDQVNATNGSHTITGYFPNGALNNVSFTVERADYTEESNDIDPHLNATNDYIDGWNYIDNQLVYYEAENGYVYELASGSFSLTERQAHLVYTYPAMGRSETAILSEATFDGTNVSGYMEIDGISTLVTVDRGDVRIEETYVDGWNYSYDNENFIYYDFNLGEIYQGECTSGTIFYSFAVDDADLNFQTTIHPQTDPEVKEFSVNLLHAKYDYSYVEGEYLIMTQEVSYYAAIKVNKWNALIEEIGWKYVGDSNDGYFQYLWNSSELTPKMESVYYYNYDNRVYDEVRITYAAYEDDDYDDESKLIRRDTVVLGDAGVRNETRVKVFGEFKDTMISITISSLEVQEVTIGYGFNYLDGLDELIYYDLEKRYDVEYLRAVYYEDDDIFTVYCNIRDSQSVYMSTNFDLTSAYFIDESNGEFIGYFEDISRTLTITLRDIEYALGEPGWRYVDNMLIWRDPAYEAQDIYLETVIKKVTYFNADSTLEILYGIYAVNFDEMDEATGEPKPRYDFIFYKTVHFTSVEILSEPDEELGEEGYITGECLECEEATELSIPMLRYENPEAPTEDSQIAEDINSILDDVEAPEEIKETITNHIDNVPEDTGAEIVQTMENTLAVVTTKEEKEIVATVMEASVVVSANKANSIAEAIKVDEKLPEDTGLDASLEDTINIFIQDQLDYLLGKKDVREIENNSSRSIKRDGNRIDNIVDLTISKEDYAKMIGFVDTAVSNMKDAALQIRKCSAATMKASINDYIYGVRISSFREFDEEAANAEFVEAIKEAIMLNMQQQVIEALKREYKPSNNAQKEAQYREQLAACEDIETFKQIVLEVLRLKYVSLTKEDIDIDTFKPIYDEIFRSWALDDPSINPTSITLEELTTATIETTTTKASKIVHRDSISKEESTFLIILGSAVGGVCVVSIVMALIMKPKRRRLAK